MLIIELNTIRNGLPTLTSDWGNFLSEAGLYCLLRANHVSGVSLKLMNREDNIRITWNYELDFRAKYSYCDEEEATEYGAICISILLAINLTPFTTVQRACKGGSFDYWLGTSDESNHLPFQECARLEISGIKTGNEIDISNRTKEKLNRYNAVNQKKLPFYISIIEFSKPRANFVEIT